VETAQIYEDAARTYHRCSRCSLVFVPARFHPGPAEEKARYDLHRNDPADPDYRAFLERLALPLAAKLAPGARGLDFGCGPKPVLARILSGLGFTMLHYDPFYAPDAAALDTTYDFIACSETVEHFFNPRAGWELMLRLTRPGGWIGVMTSPVEETESFGDWHYRRDPTHVSFYSRETFMWLAQSYCLEVEFASGTVALFKRRGEAEVSSRRAAGG